jgi:hypothetical protein
MTISNNLKTRLQVALADPAAADEIETILETPSSGLPNGGTTGQALVKASNDNQDVEWSTISGGVTEFAELTDLSNSSIEGPVQLNSDNSFEISATNSVESTFSNVVCNAQDGLAYTELSVEDGNNLSSVQIRCEPNVVSPFINMTADVNNKTVFANLFISGEETPNIVTSVGTENAGAGITIQISADEIPFVLTQGTLQYNKINYNGAETAELTYEGMIHVFVGTEPDQNVVIDWSKVGDTFILINDTAESVVFEGSDAETFNGSATLTLTTGKMATCVQSTNQVFHCIISP